VRRRLHWGDDRDEPPLAHPYRDAALVYLGFAVVIVLVAVATGGGLVSALAVAGLFWLAATAFSVVTLRRRRKLR
jgi:Flp pilus assembly protein TadB